MPVSVLRHNNLALSPFLGWPIVAAGLVAIFATYWDEAFHTDVGRDSAWASPHVLLYGSVAVVGLGVAAWGVRVVLITRSLRATANHLPLLAAGLGALGALAAAPIDAVWHTSYGRDAVLWSPPHVLVVFSATALTLGVIVGIAPEQKVLRTAGGVLLLANALTVVFEYEADVPQFSEVFYLPVLELVGLAVAIVISRTVPVPLPVTGVVVGYVALRLAVIAGLAAMGRSTPDLPIAVLGLAAYDLPLQSRVARASAAGLATAALATAAAAVGVASPGLPQVALGTGAVAAVAVAALGGHRRRSVPTLVVLVLSAAMVTSSPEPAAAHDPGQGELLAPVSFTASSNGRGAVAVRIVADDHCDDLTARRLVARRAGEEVIAVLTRIGCTYSGTIDVDPTGRWFVYAEFTHEDTPAEVWLPVDSSAARVMTRSRPVYVAEASDTRVTGAQVAWGGSLYLAGLCLLMVGVLALRRDGGFADVRLSASPC